MKLSIFAPVFSHFMGPVLSFEDMLDTVVAVGADAVDFGCGPLNGELLYSKPDDLLGSNRALAEFREAVESRGLTISGLSCHGNPLHPDADVARIAHEAYLRTVRLAERLGVRVVTLFSGCPGDDGGSRYPNWVASNYPPEMRELLAWQWEQAVIPYWRDAGRVAEEHGVQLAFELHPGMVVFNPATLLRLRDAVGSVVGAAVDVAHLLEQSIDPVVAVRDLGDALAAVQAKDVEINAGPLARHGVFAPEGAFWQATEDSGNPYRTALDKPFTSGRTIGFGHDLAWWKSFVSALRVVGYDHALTLEQADPLASVPEGFARSIALLRETLFDEPGLASRPPGSAWVDGAWRFTSDGRTG